MKKYTFTTASLRAIEAKFDKLSVGDIDDVNSFMRENLVFVDEVIDSYHSDDYWYRLYKSGWVEQGGETSGSNSSLLFNKEFADTNYTCVITAMSAGGGSTFHSIYFGKTTTGITNVLLGQNGTAGRTDGNYTHAWYAAGFAK